MSRSYFASHASAVNSRTWRLLAWLGVALQAVALIGVLLMERGGGAWTIGAFLLLSVGFLLYQDRTPGVIDFCLVLAAMLNAAGWAWNFFDQFVWYDETVHFFTTFAVAAAIGHLLWRHTLREHTLGTASLVLRFAALGLGLGIAWEIVEMTFLNLKPVDTLVDLVMDTAGAAVGGPFTAWVSRRERVTA